MAVRKNTKKKLVANVQFSFKGELYKKGAEFKANRKQVAALIIKNLIKWQL